MITYGISDGRVFAFTSKHVFELEDGDWTKLAGSPEAFMKFVTDLEPIGAPKVDLPKDLLLMDD